MSQNRAAVQTDIATARGRVGIVNGDTLYFISGGIASGNVTTRNSDFITQMGSTILTSATGASVHRLFGWTIGGGIETRFAERWSIKLEYLYINLGSQDVKFVNTCGKFCSTTTVAMHTAVEEKIFRTGINFHF